MFEYFILDIRLSLPVNKNISPKLISKLNIDENLTKKFTDFTIFYPYLKNVKTCVATLSFFNFLKGMGTIG